MMLNYKFVLNFRVAWERKSQPYGIEQKLQKKISLREEKYDKKSQ